MEMKHASAKLGFLPAEPYCGHAYATEAAWAPVSFGFKRLKLHRISAHHLASNIASAHVLANVGMRREGLLREATGMARVRACCGPGVLRTEWEALTLVRTNAF